MPIAIAAPIDAVPPVVSPLTTRSRWIWIASSGATVELTRFTDDLEVERGMSGSYMPRLRWTRDIVPGQAGQRTRQVLHDLREVAFPIVAAPRSNIDLEDLVEKLVRYMDPTKGEGILRRVGRDGRFTDLFCRYAGGLELSAWGTSGPVLQRLNLIFQADDPYWYGDVVTHGYTGGTAQPWFGPGLFPPLTLGSANVIGDVTINSDSDVETWPVWKIIGPGIDPELHNLTTGESTILQLPTALTEGQTITIDTRPGYKSVIGPDGTSYRRYLSSRSLWGLVPGYNDITLALPGATSASYVSISYRSRLLAPGATKPVRAIPFTPVSQAGPSTGLVTDTVEEFV